MGGEEAATRELFLRALDDDRNDQIKDGAIMSWDEFEEKYFPLAPTVFLQFCYFWLVFFFFLSRLETKPLSWPPSPGVEFPPKPAHPGHFLKKALDVLYIHISFQELGFLKL